PNPWECLLATVLVMGNAITIEKLTHTAPDLIIRPKVGLFRTLDFFQASAILRTAESAKAEIKERLAALIGAEGSAAKAALPNPYPFSWWSVMLARQPYHRTSQRLESSNAALARLIQLSAAKKQTATDFSRCSVTTKTSRFSVLSPFAKATFLISKPRPRS